MSGTAQIGVTGLAVMGRNLARNVARNGFTVAVHSRTTARTDALVDEFGEEGSFVAAGAPERFVAALERPYRPTRRPKKDLRGRGVHFVRPKREATPGPRAARAER